LSTLSRQKLKERSEYNSFLPNFGLLSVTDHGSTLELLKKATRQSIQSRQKLKGNGEYNSFLLNFGPLSVTDHHWVCSRKKAPRHRTAPPSYNIVSKRRAREKWAQ
jgi:thymidylate synthase ThyX